MKTLTMTEVLKQLDDHLRSQGASDNTRRAYAADVRSFFYSHHHSYTIFDDAATNDALVRDWLNATRAHVSPATTNRRLSTFRVLGRVLWDQPLADGYRPPKVGRRQAHPLPNGMSDAYKLLAVCETDSERALVTLIDFCGLRVSEARSILPSSFRDAHDPSEAKLYVRGKGDKERLVPLTPMTWTLLKTLADRAATDEMGNELPLIRLSDRGARYAYTRLGRKAGISRAIATHDGRMTFGTATYEATGDLRAVQELLGHSSVTTTQGYVRSSQESQRAAVLAAVGS